MPYSVHTKQNVTKAWDEPKLEKKLEGLAHAEKSQVWVHRNLSTDQSGFFGRAFWGIAKHFNWMRRAFYDVDLERSKEILIELQPQIQTQGNEKLSKLYEEAVNHFNQIAPHHMVILIKTKTPTPAKPAAPQPQVSPVKPEVSKDYSKILAEINHGKISPNAAVIKLAGKPQGTYLLRTSEIDDNVKIFNYVDLDGLIKEFRLTKTVGDAYTDATNKTYPNLEKFLQEKEGLGILKIPFVTVPASGAIPLTPMAKPTAPVADPKQVAKEKVQQALYYNSNSKQIKEMLTGKPEGTFAVYKPFESLYLIAIMGPPEE